jgi:hypothetical protein
MQLLDWQYLIFLLPIGFGTMYLLLMAVGMFGGEDGSDISAGHDISVDHGEVGVDHGSIETGHGDIAHGDMAHGDLGHAEGGSADAGHDLHPSILDVLLGFLGFGKVPMSILIMSYCFVWGGVGLAVLRLLSERSVGRAAGTAAAASVLVTRYLAIAIAKLVPSMESYHVPLSDLEGLSGEVLYAVTQDSGTVRVRDQRRNLRDVPCRVAPGEKNISAGNKVVLFCFDKKTRTFIVAP